MRHVKGRLQGMKQACDEKDMYIVGADDTLLPALLALALVVEDVVKQDLFPNPDCPEEASGCDGCLEDAMEGKRRLVSALAGVV